MSLWCQVSATVHSPGVPGVPGAPDVPGVPGVPGVTFQHSPTSETAAGERDDLRHTRLIISLIIITMTLMVVALNPIY